MSLAWEKRRERDEEGKEGRKREREEEEKVGRKRREEGREGERKRLGFRIVF